MNAPDNDGHYHSGNRWTAIISAAIVVLFSAGLPARSQEKPFGEWLPVVAEFFQAHMANWVDRFYQDLSLAKQAVFYRAVGRFGTAFFQFESDYLAMKV